MDIPQDKNPATPATGAAARVTGPPAPPQPPPDGGAEDFAIGEEVFSQTVISLPPRSQRGEPAKGVFKDLNPPPADVREVEARKSKKQLLNKRGGSVDPNFKRLMVRPETAMVAHLAVDQARAESAVSMEQIEHGTMQFGKIHPHASPDYRPNRLFRVLDGIYTHSPLKWLDFVDRTGARFLAGLLLFLIIGGVVAWRYFSSLSDREVTQAAENEVTLTSDQRVERGRTAVKEFLAAQTIEARLPFVLDPERAAGKMRQYYDTMQGRNPATVEWNVGEPVGGEHGAWLPFTFKDNAGRKVTVVMGEDAGGCRIDWENFVAFGDLPWAEFCRTRPVTPIPLRVRLRRVESYAGHYTKENWQSFEIEHRGGAPALVGYAGRAGRTAQDLAELVKSDQWQATLVYLRFDAGADGSLVVIDQVIRSRWQDELTTWTNP